MGYGNASFSGQCYKILTMIRIRENGIGDCFFFRSTIDAQNDKAEWDRGMLPFQVSNKYC